ncbi:histidinol-phosphate transaminase [Aidingimonas lacisalsi]|uniref:histidinol-phosphate transaminase n=1 Tax=Aidingimonas lacisalsi TaxID=2604086 RepID=UPI0011D19FF7|nr:histidinol-phosphate transaminase [Aidingimonas lacisalsi]
MSKYWSPSVRELTPYVPGEQPRERMIKLNTNENPYPPAPGVEQVLREFPADHLRRYPDPESWGLRCALAANYNVEANQVFVGNGSDEVLAFAFQAFFRQERPLSIPAITYSFYPVYCRLYGIDYRTLALGDEWQVPLEALDADSGGIIFANPNAPIGHSHSRDAIEKLLERVTECVVVIDEAYVDFGGETATPLVNRYPNLLITNTFSKSRSLAGLRLGFAIGSPELIEGLERVKNSFNSYPIDCIAHDAGIAALEDEQYFETCRSRIIATRDDTRRQLQQLGFDVLPSQANFLLVRHPHHEADQLFLALRDRGILVRHFNTEALQDFMRISIGTDDEMAHLVETLSELTR